MMTPADDNHDNSSPLPLPPSPPHPRPSQDHQLAPPSLLLQHQQQPLQNQQLPGSLPPSPTRQGYYHHHYHARPHPPHGHPARPHSALVRDSRPQPLDPRTHRDLIANSRRPSVARSLPHTYDRGTPTPPSGSPPSSSPNAFLAADRGNSLDVPKAQPQHVERYAVSDLDIQRPAPSHHSASPARVLSTYSLSDDEDEDQTHTLTVRQTVRSLLHLSLSAAPLSFALILYAIVSLLYTVIASPLRLCIKSRPCFSRQLGHLLLPPLNLQRRCIFQPPLFASPSRSSSSSRTPLSSDEAVQSHSSLDDALPISAGTLFSIHLLAPLIAFPLAFGAWIVGGAWLMGAMVSDERAGDDRDERRLAQRLIGWWASWLDLGLSEGELSRGSSSHHERGRGRRRQEMSMKRNEHHGPAFA